MITVFAMKRFELVVCGLLLVGAAASARAQSAANVAVVINESDAASLKVGEYYVAQREIPASNVIRIKTTSDETIERDAFADGIRAPIAAALTRGNLIDRVLYIVLTKGVPLRIAGTAAGRDGRERRLRADDALSAADRTGAAHPGQDCESRIFWGAMLSRGAPVHASHLRISWCRASTGSPRQTRCRSSIARRRRH